MNDTKRQGWLAYVAPMAVFLALVEISSRFFETDQLGLLALRVMLPAAVLAFFFYRGAYKELRPRWTAMTLVDVGLGVVLAALWVCPYLLFPSIRPESVDAFDRTMAGGSMVAAVLAIRMVGYAVVTPVMEELFMRSFLMRMVDSYDSEKEFDELPIGAFSWRNFVVVTVVFLATHAMWEWWVMLPWAVLTNLWFYYRKDLFALVMLHGATNASILIAAIVLGGRYSLWFLV